MNVGSTNEALPNTTTKGSNLGYTPDYIAAPQPQSTQPEPYSEQSFLDPLSPTPTPELKDTEDNIDNNDQVIVSPISIDENKVTADSDESSPVDPRTQFATNTGTFTGNTSEESEDSSEYGAIEPEGSDENSSIDSEYVDPNIEKDSKNAFDETMNVLRTEILPSNVAKEIRKTALEHAVFANLRIQKLYALNHDNPHWQFEAFLKALMDKVQDIDQTYLTLSNQESQSEDDEKLLAYEQLMQTIFDATLLNEIELLFKEALSVQRQINTTLNEDEESSDLENKYSEIDAFIQERFNEYCDSQQQQHPGLVEMAEEHVWNKLVAAACDEMRNYSEEFVEWVSVQQGMELVDPEFLSHWVKIRTNAVINPTPFQAERDVITTKFIAHVNAEDGRTRLMQCIENALIDYAVEAIAEIREQLMQSQVQVVPSHTPTLEQPQPGSAILAKFSSDSKRSTPLSLSRPLTPIGGQSPRDLSPAANDDSLEVSNSDSAPATSNVIRHRRTGSITTPPHTPTPM